ncbi:TetR/AcrR family transcriptional regulator [Streptomyces sp. NBC_00490]|uniref:TetR/AcrR family transcriptional regulator n=1 Tax=Streptomyces sp. NBC_00490 TaxID=2903657 RepID=UPI002E186929
MTQPRTRAAQRCASARKTALPFAQGINATGMDQLSTVAGVSKRTLYTHFPSKDELVGAYLESLVEPLLPASPSSTQAALSPREQLLAIFDRKPAETTAPFRGCPFLNASVEVPDPGHSAHQLAVAYKKEFTHRLTDIARQAGAADPDKLAEQLALLFDGAAARGTALNDNRTGACARSIAELVVDAALAEVGPPSS